MQDFWHGAGGVGFDMFWQALRSNTLMTALIDGMAQSEKGGRLEQIGEGARLIHSRDQNSTEALSARLIYIYQTRASSTSRSKT
jgi:hypothetical protein